MGRRVVLAAGTVLAVGGSGGCALNNPFDDSETPAADAVPDLAPDVGRAVTAAAAITAQRDLVDATVAAFPGLAAQGARFTAMHEAHLAALLDAVPDGVDLSPTTAPVVRAGDRGAALQVLLHGETQVRSTLVALSLRADSGVFARLLGSMAASVSQHLVARP